MARCEHGWGGDDDCPDCLDEYIAEQDALSVLETRAEEAERDKYYKWHEDQLAATKKAEARVKELEDELRSSHWELRSWRNKRLGWREEIRQLTRQRDRLKAANARLRARVKSLEQRRPAVHDLFEDLQLDYFELQARVKELEADVEHLTHANGLMAPELVRLRARNKELREATTKGGE